MTFPWQVACVLHFVSTQLRLTKNGPKFFFMKCSHFSNNTQAPEASSKYWKTKLSKGMDVKVESATI